MILTQKNKTAGFTPGGKARGLYRLQEAGLAVPPFLVIAAEAFDPYLAGQQGMAAEGIREKLLQFTLPAAAQEQVGQLLARWGFPAQAVVVRSSVADEDGETHAFPGLMDSFLNLSSLADVFAAVAACAASSYSPRALAYRQHKKLSQGARPAVIIQKQVAAEASGVMFTTFPEYPQELAIHAVWGFGEGLVGGMLEADEFYLLKKNGRLNRQKTALKEVQLAATLDKGLRPEPVPASRQTFPCLSSAQLSALYQTGTRLETAFRRPQDVEFVVAGEEIFIVQARPLIQPIPEVTVYDNSNIQESYCGVTTPLTFSFASRAYATVYRQTMQVLGLPEKTIRAKEPVVRALLGLVQGRIYYNINNWYRGLQLLPSFRQNKQDMERMMGLEEPVDFVEDRQKTLPEKLRLLPGLMVNLSRLLWAFYRLPERVPAFQEHCRRYCQSFFQKDLAAFSWVELLAEKDSLDREMLQNWTTPIINDFYVMMANGRVARRLKKAGIADTDEFLSRYLSGDQQIESTQPARALQLLAQQAWQQPHLRTLVLAMPEDLHGLVWRQFPDFHAAAEAFIGQYGDRTVGELKLETRTMRTDPLIFYKYLRNYLVAGPPPLRLAAAGSHLHEAAEQELKGLLRHRAAYSRRRVWNSLRTLQQAIRYRESLRLERTRLFGMYRALYLAMGEQLVRNQKLARRRDIFYLSEAEIGQALRNEEPAGFTNLVQERQLEFEAYKKQDVPARVVLPSPPQAPQPGAGENPGLLQGSGCFPGMVSGEILVVSSPEGDLDVSGKIVCALRTDPGWAALFPVCKGVLIEKGSSLSHSVILLRELGIPTIINIPRLTKALKSGQQVSMNGSSGEIQIQQHENH